MAKSSYYFDHDYNARNDQKILELRAEYGWEGYGIFYGIIEVLCESDGKIKRGALGGLSLGLSMAKPELIKLIDFMLSIELLFEVDGIIYSKRVNDHLEFRTMLSEAGKRGGRPSKKPPLSQAKATPKAGKESKEEEIIEREIIEPKIKGFIKPKLSEIIEYCNERKNVINPNSFFDHYESNGWMVGRTKMKDWKATIRKWESSDFNNSKPTQNGTRLLQFEPKIPTI